MLFILLALFYTTNSIRRNQLTTVMKVKESYEADNSRAVKIYEELTEELESRYVYVEDFDTLPNYPSSNTTYTVNNGIINLSATAYDPMIYMSNVTSFSPLTYRYIEVRYRTNSASTMEFFMIENPTDQTYSVTGQMIGDGEWHILTIDLWTNEAVKNRSSITGWRWDWRLDSAGTVDVDYIKIRK